MIGKSTAAANGEPSLQQAAPRDPEGLEALASLLLCVDPTRWRSLAQPSARGLGMLILSQLENP